MPTVADHTAIKTYDLRHHAKRANINQQITYADVSRKKGAHNTSVDAAFGPKYSNQMEATKIAACAALQLLSQTEPFADLAWPRILWNTNVNNQTRGHYPCAHTIE